MSKKVAVLPSQYLAWKGYFDLINDVDACFFYENGHGHCTHIKTPNGLQPLTINLQESSWATTHWSIIEANYARTPRFREYAYVMYAIYHAMSEKSLQRINHIFIRTVCDILGIHTSLSVTNTDCLLTNCQQANATHLLADPAQKIDLSAFAEAGIAVEYMNYSDYPIYHQLYPPFEHHVSILDLIFNEGQDAPRYMKLYD